MGYLFATPRSVREIRNIANQCRNFLKLSPIQRVNVPKLLDILCIFWREYGFQYLVLPDNSKVFGPREEAKTDIASGQIYIKESVMNEACRHRYKRAAFTITHEIGHFVLHRMLGGVSLARTTSIRKPRPFEDPEWQANTFASEFLMPVEAVKKMSVQEIKKTFCVSKECAKVRYRKVRGEFIAEEIENIL